MQLAVVIIVVLQESGPLLKFFIVSITKVFVFKSANVQAIFEYCVATNRKQFGVT